MALFHKPANLLTIYGRKPVQEALQDPGLDFFRVHLARSNRRNAVLDDIQHLCRQRGIEVHHHDRLELSRISGNRKQDQGVAADIRAPHFANFGDTLTQENPPGSLLALDGITNPQNLGMIIRSVRAGFPDGLLLPRRGCARLDSLVIKASAGTLFKARLLFCDTLESALRDATRRGHHVCALATGNGSRPLGDRPLPRPHILVLGNESRGLSPAVAAACGERRYIPMREGVESLNVAVAAGVVAFMPLLAETAPDHTT